MAGPFDGLKYTPDAAPAPANDADDPDLAFLKPRAPGGNPFAGLKYQPDAPVAPTDQIGRAAADYQANLDALRSGHPGGAAPTPSEGDKVAPYGLSGLVTGQAGQGAAPQPDVSGPAAALVGASQGSSLGWADELAARADTLVSKIPGLRDVREAGAEKFFGHPAGALDYSNPDLTYEQRRDAYRAYLNAAKTQHGKLYTVGEIGGGILATPALPEIGATKGLSTAAKLGRVGLVGSEIGGIAGAGGSEATNTKDYLKDIGISAGVGGAGGVVLHAGAEKAAKALATKLPALADKQAIQALARAEGKAGAPESLTRPMVQDPNISNAINEEIPVGAKGKTVTLAQVAGRPAAEVQPVLKAAQEKTAQGIQKLGEKAEQKAGAAKLSDLAAHYDAESSEFARQPGNEKHVNALQGAKEDALAAWGPSEEAIEARKGEIGKQTEKLYGASDKKVGGATLGDLVQHYNDQIAIAKKTPGNEAIVNALEGARDSAMKAWGSKPVIDPNVKITAAGGGPHPYGRTAGEALKMIDRLKAANPEDATLAAESDRIRAAANQGDKIDLSTKVPAKDVRAYATHLQNEGAVNTTDPKIAARAKQFIGATTKDFINGHVEKTLGPADRKALETLNRRTADLYAWPDVLAGKNTDTAVRDRVLNEFDTRIPHKDLDTFASKLEEKGTQRIDKLQPGEIAQAKENLGRSTRVFAGKTAAAGLSPEEQAEYERLVANRASQKNIEKVLNDRASKEAQKKAGLVGSGLRAAGHTVGALELANAIPKAVSGDFGGAALDVGKAAVAAGLPHIVPAVAGAKRGLIRGLAGSTTMIANLAANAEKGNPWAMRMMDLLKSTPAGAARLAAALAHAKGGVPETPEGP